MQLLLEFIYIDNFTSVSTCSILNLPNIMDDPPEPLSIETEIIIILMLVIVNGIFAMTEMANGVLPEDDSMIAPTKETQAHKSA